MNIDIKKTQEKLYKDITRKNPNVEDLVTVEQMHDIMEQLGLGNIKPNLLNLEVGDLYYKEGAEFPLQVVWDHIRPEDTADDILTKRMIPLANILYPKEMKQIKPMVMAKGYSLFTSRGIDDNVFNKIKKFTGLYENMPEGYDNGEFIVNKDVSVIHTGREIIYTAPYEKENFITLCYFFVQKRNFKNINDADLSRYGKFIIVTLKRVWYTNTFEVASVTGLPNTTVSNIDKYITIGYTSEKENEIIVKLRLADIANSHDIGYSALSIADFTIFNSEAWLVSACHSD